MNTLKTALACWLFLSLGLTWDFVFNDVGLRTYVATVMMMYALALLVAAFVEFVAMFMDWVKERFFE